MTVNDKLRGIILGVTGLALVAGYSLFVSKNGGNCAVPGGPVDVSAAALLSPPGEEAPAAPRWSAETLEGETVSTADLQGKVVIVNFWATWCGPCRQSIPVYEKLQQEYADRGFTVVGMSLDQAGADHVRQFVESREMSYPVALAPEQTVATFGPIQHIPTTFVLDGKGKIRYRHVGAADEATLRAEIEGLLASS